MRANRKYWPCFIAAICGVIAITLSACSGKTPVIEHQVIFDANGGEWEETYDGGHHQDCFLTGSHAVD